MGKFKGDNKGRRDFLRTISATGAFSLMPVSFALSESRNALENLKRAKGVVELSELPKRKELNLSPASWIWFPAERILPNSFFHFRKVLKLNKSVRSAKGWIQAESRYVLFLNGQRIQFGPAPSDPRYAEADPIDLTDRLKIDDNVFGATVVYFGFGDGAWPAGKAGFIFRLEIGFEDGEKSILVSDETWSVQQAKSWPSGKYKRWYLRALQEEFDNRLYPDGWNDVGFSEDNSWKKAKVFSKEAQKTALSSSISDYLYDSGGNQNTQLRRRTVPLILEKPVHDFQLKEVHTLNWNTSIEEYFDFKTENAFQVDQIIDGFSEKGATWEFEVPKSQNQGLVLSFEMQEHAIGWPFVTISCSEGTTVEMLVQQGHELLKRGGPALINNNFNSWTRFICKEGENQFMSFDYESVKWIQLHIHHAVGTVKISHPGLLRRVYDFPFQPTVETSHEGFNRLLGACINTVWNNSHDTIVDCVGRERQQYSGDIGHMIHALHVGFGEGQLPYRFVDTFSQGLTLGGFFMDSWPAYDRLNRLAQRQLDLTPWGVLLDHSVGFCYDCWNHYLYSGKKEDLEEAFPRLLRFFELIQSSLDNEGLLQVENLGVNAIWMDTDSYKAVRDKQCAYNLYVASMLKLALAPLAAEFGLDALKNQMFDMSLKLAEKVEAKFYLASEGLLVINLPWLDEDKEKRTCERSLAHWVLGGFVPKSSKKAVLNELTTLPKRLGRCYPANTIWTYWACSALGNTEFILKDFDQRWLPMLSVKENNTIQEHWQAEKDTQNQLSHAGIAPFYAAYMCFAGIEVIRPGGSLVRVKPQPASLEKLKLTYHTSYGPMGFNCQGKKGNRKLILSIPKGVLVHLEIPSSEKIPHGAEKVTADKNEFTTVCLSGGKVWEIDLLYV
ncbi:alpha-L-rhamnosidase N-terminal domain-containing protein [Arthrospiribacter ruber]|uniref:Alpha-L-rhamnosidase n=1 Tax=Arthrospiribacter ruber TaxID=2487934 RepID=A0A951MF95_9BACT|nr:alpha-L-rhamnosidase N-terminal domain-containing protein [Arthrospiribacter ruber]MBW3469752.1 alpha-L-rhamnosidase [Arthrospiribacter ruber]